MSDELEESVRTIVLVDDHPLILDGLDQLFKIEPRFEVIGRCRRVQEAIDTISRKRPDLVILDLRLGNGNGLEVLARTAETSAVILLTAGLDGEELHEALELGAKGVILKERAAEQLLECTERVASGDLWIDPNLSQRVLERVDRVGKRESLGRLLSPREVEITRLVGQGLRNKEIATSLSITEGTVKTHMRSIFEKTGVDSRVGLVLWARTQQLDS